MQVEFATYLLGESEFLAFPHCVYLCEIPATGMVPIPEHQLAYGQILPISNWFSVHQRVLHSRRATFLQMVIVPQKHVPAGGHFFTGGMMLAAVSPLFLWPPN